MPERETDRDTHAASGGTVGVIPVPPEPPPPEPVPIFQVLGLVFAGAGVVAGLLGRDNFMLILCGLAALFLAASLFTDRSGWVKSGGTVGVIPVPPRPLFLILALIAAIAGVIAGWLGYMDALLVLCGLSAVFNLISLAFWWRDRTRPKR